MATTQDTTTILPAGFLDGSSSAMDEEDSTNKLSVNGSDIASNATTVDTKDGNLFLNMEQSTLILIGGLAALVIIVLVVVAIVVIYIRYKSRSRRQVNVAPDHRVEPETVTGDTVPLT